MPHLEQIDNRWRRAKKECIAVIETPKGRRNKLSYDEELDAFRLDFILPKGMTFPYDFGFIPRTLAPDGDALDVLVLMEEPADVGCVVPVRIVGIVEAEQREGSKRFRNDRVLAVSVHSFQHSGIKKAGDIDQTILNQLEEFFVSYNKARGRGFRVKGVHGPNRAADAIDATHLTYKKKHKS
ncbi:MAG TPA: inorganic diphosphatase [Gemmatimonadaceae bacterium]|nr:inorganic diphosphatase [Gemmatimonadaceae bacterium]